MNKINNNQLHNIIKESLHKVLTESFNGNVCEELYGAIDLLKSIMTSGFIPFASPSPSSTELALKNRIIKAHDLLEDSIELCKQLGYCK